MTISEAKKTILLTAAIIALHVGLISFIRGVFPHLRHYISWSGLEASVMLVYEVLWIIGVMGAIWHFRFPLDKDKPDYRWTALLMTAFVVVCVSSAELLGTNFLGAKLRFLFGSGGDYSPLITNQTSSQNDFPWYISFLFGVIVAPIKEELLFRVLLLQQVRRVVPGIVAVLASSLIFALYHCQWFEIDIMREFLLVDVLPLFVAGIASSLIYLRYGFWTALTAHMLFNSKGYFLDYLKIYPTTLFILALLGTVFFVSMFITQIKGQQTDEGKQ